MIFNVFHHYLAVFVLLFIPVAIVNFLHQQRRGWNGILITESNIGRNICFLIKSLCIAWKQLINALDVSSSVNNITLRYFYLRYSTWLIEIES